ncbi:hypothetical protein [Yersinia aleksiciae]|uniref:hypothetical protein n=1 Tax=Yersinia aleksiciae TaxID=263819 RepID=UPI0011A6EBF1|nr:hypothetical protein [Yersinia aleksiciae]
MKLERFARPSPILDEQILASIEIGSLVKVQLTDGISNIFNDTVVLKVTGRDDHELECTFERREIDKCSGDKNTEFKSPFELEKIRVIKQCVFAIENN